MFNLLKMDLRRLFKSRSFHMMLAVTAALILGLVALVAVASDPKKLDALEDTGMVATDGSSEELQEELRGMTRLDFAHECLGSGFLLLLTGIGVTLFVHSDFSSGYAKNICFVRPRRWEYVLSKLLMAGVYSGAITILGVLLSITAPVLFGLSLTASPIGGVLQYALCTWLPSWAFGLMALALVTLTRSSTLGLVLSVFAGGGVTAAVLRTVCQQLGWPDFAQYLLSSVAQFQCVPMPNPDQIGMILACSIGWTALYTVGSLLAMEKRDI